MWSTYMFSGEDVFMCMEVACVSTSTWSSRGNFGWFWGCLLTPFSGQAVFLNLKLPNLVNWPVPLRSAYLHCQALALQAWPSLHNLRIGAGDLNMVLYACQAGIFLSNLSFFFQFHPWNFLLIINWFGDLLHFYWARFDLSRNSSVLSILKFFGLACLFPHSLNTTIVSSDLLESKIICIDHVTFYFKIASFYCFLLLVSPYFPGFSVLGGNVDHQFLSPSLISY